MVSSAVALTTSNPASGAAFISPLCHSEAPAPPESDGRSTPVIILKCSKCTQSNKTRKNANILVVVVGTAVIFSNLFSFWTGQPYINCLPYNVRSEPIRHRIATRYISLRMPGTLPRWHSPDHDCVEVLGLGLTPTLVSRTPDSRALDGQDRLLGCEVRSLLRRQPALKFG